MNPRPSQSEATAGASQVDIACPQCNALYRVAATLTGRRFQCRKCGHVWRWGARPARTTSAESGVNMPSSEAGVAAPPAEAIPVAGSGSTIIDMSWVGKRLGRYRLKSVLGRGGMGVVWRAQDLTLNRDVAIKILTPPSGRGGDGTLSRALFLQEARAAAKLNHPGAVTVFEIAEDGGAQFIAMELMQGGMLRDHIEAHGPMEPRRLFRLLVAPTRALALAHERGIIHRDVKPGNLMFDDHGQLKLGDFGLSDVADDPTSLTLRGRSVGSLGWVAPETARGEQTLPASDIYAMGLVMLYALTGKPWLAAETRSKLLELHQNPPPLDLSDIEGLTPDASALLHRCLAPNPADRFRTAEELATLLEHCANEPDEPLIPQSVLMRSRARAIIASVGLAILAIALSIAFIFGYLQYLASGMKKPQSRPQPRQVVTIEPAGATEPGDGADGRDAGNWSWLGRVDERGLLFIASRQDRLYHVPSCLEARRILLRDMINYGSREAATGGGRTPCPICRPDVNDPSPPRD